MIRFNSFSEAFALHYVDYGNEHMSMARAFISMINDKDIRELTTYMRKIRRSVIAHILTENSDTNRGRNLNTFIFTEFFFRTQEGKKLGIRNEPKYLVCHRVQEPKIRKEFLEQYSRS